MVQFDYAKGGTVVEARPTASVPMREGCDRKAEQCREDTVVIDLEGRALISEATRDVPSSILGFVRTDLEDLRPMMRAFQDDRSNAQAVRALVLYFTTQGRPQILCAYTTNELRSDHYQYGERLYSLEQQGISRDRETKYFFDVAGLEGLDWRWLWPVNVLVLLLLFLTVKLVSQSRTSPASPVIDPRRIE